MRRLFVLLVLLAICTTTTLTFRSQPPASLAQPPVHPAQPSGLHNRPGLRDFQSSPSADQPSSPLAQPSKLLDEVLDLYVRDGEVYYRALKADRRRLDGFIGQIANLAIDNLPRNERLALWLNVYDALVLRTVVDHYPIQGTSRDYPPRSIRQVSGAFERLPHRIAGRTLTLDQIEQTVLPEFGDPRVYLALGRGAEGGGRLRSEAFTPSRLETQLAEAAAECVSRQQCIQIDTSANKVIASSVFSWREKEFSAAYADQAPPVFASRSPIERAIITLVRPKLLTAEKEFVERNTFQVVYRPFDWRLNDLTGRGGR
jgi:hypothetical protein